MRFKPSPLVESSATFALSFLIVVLWLTIDRSLASDVFVGASNIAFIFLFPAFTLWSLTGLLVRDRSHWFRAVTNLATTLLVSFVVSFFVIPSQEQLLDAKVAALAEQNIRALFVALIANLIAGIITYLFFIRVPAVKKNSSAYRVIDTSVKPNSKRKKK
jgi:hypothetical protein